jgi:hypothetical protein
MSFVENQTMTKIGRSWYKRRKRKRKKGYKCAMQKKQKQKPKQKRNRFIDLSFVQPYGPCLLHVAATDWGEATDH